MADSDDVVERLGVLQQQDWERIILQLLHYAAKRFSAAGVPIIKDGIAGLPSDHGVVRGVSIQDLVQDAIESVWNGDRSWDPKKDSLVAILRGVVSSKVSNLLTSPKVQKIDEWPEGEDEDGSMEDKMHRKHADPSQDHARYLVQPSATPEEILEGKEVQEAIEQRYDLFLEAAGDDEELFRYLDSLDRGLEKPANIAKEWEVDVKLIYNVRNRLKRNLQRLRRSMETG